MKTPHAATKTQPSQVNELTKQPISQGFGVEIHRDGQQAPRWPQECFPAPSPTHASTSPPINCEGAVPRHTTASQT